ncbi:hypothetical protein [Mesorhizobium sp.]|uniref:hypothetical protein n=1 Tax=Mesorhizobium sp. TaxID=1871066 RepID=UPI0025C2851A|nr:hypothetical protein [Mesorhizobium sp.]
MGDIRRVKADLKRGVSVMSAAATEAFNFLNRLTQREYRGWGDTATAARDRAARNAGITPAQAERVWKRWQRMASIDGDVYRALRNKYEQVCEANEQAAAAYRAERLELRNKNAVDQKRSEEGMGTDVAGD